MPSIPLGTTGEEQNVSDDLEKGVRLINAAIDEDGEGNIIFRGVLDPGYLHLLNVHLAVQGGYQREELSPLEIERKANSFLAGEAFPDIVLGMRGQRFQDEPDGATRLLDPLFIIDGQQRRAGALKAIQMRLGFQPRLGATVYVNTTPESEAAFFVKLNTLGKRVTPGVLLQIAAQKSPPLETLLLLTKDRSFALGDRVRWDQNKTQNHLLPALTYVKTVISLHRHVSASVGNSKSHIDDYVSSVNKISTGIGTSALRDNTRVFFEVIDHAWKLRKLTAKDASAPQLRYNFLMALSAVFSRNLNFWDDEGKELFVKVDDVRKLATFDTTTDLVRSCTSGGSQAQRHLITLLEAHLNSGRRSGRLVVRPTGKYSRGYLRIGAGGEDEKDEGDEKEQQEEQRSA